MRKYVKTIFQNAIGELEKINKEIEELLDDDASGDGIEEVVALLADAQQAAIEIGSQIEKLEGQGTAAVKALEVYCELLWQLSQEREAETQGALVEGLKSTLEIVKNEINNLPERYEIVFLPYKVSMWDCMESVWMAANEDPDCTVKVIPIPYYDRNSDGSLSEMHYEGAKMPEYVEVTHYNDYSIEERHPDIVYIHNPYDGGNYVSCVHPKFFSSELKKSTDMLVYIPYFMAGKGPYPDIHWNLPAYQHADKIIIQDEEKLEGLRQYVPEEKLVVAGSPKADRVRRLEGERQHLVDNVIPKNWRDKMQGKKVFLYNVSLSGILKNSDTAMDKIRYILEVFARRDDVVLLWRPHPLIESTLKTLRPSLYSQYKQLKEEFIKKDKGIFDETADVGISAAISDAYIGEDSSSMIHYFSVVGKDILYTDWKIRAEKTEDERRAMLVTDCFEEEGKLYFTPNMKGMEHELYYLELKTGEITLETIMPGKACGEPFPYYDMASVGRKIVLTAYNASDMYIYDRNKKRAVKLPLLAAYTELNFDRSFIYKDKLILKPKNYPAIVKLDVDTLEMTEYEAGLRCFECKEGEEVPFMWACAVKENLLYMAAVAESRMYIFNMDDGSYEIKHIGEYDFGYFSMVYDGTYFWLAVHGKTSIIRWQEETGECVEIPYLSEEEAEEYASGILIDIGESLLIFHCNGSAVLQVEKQTLSVTKHWVPIEKRDVAEDFLDGYSFARKIDDGHVVAFRRSDSSFVKWDVLSGKAKVYPLRMSVEQMLGRERKEIEIWKKQNGDGHALQEWQLTINQYVDYVKQAKSMGNARALEKICKDTIYGQEVCGEKIHRKVRGYDIGM